MMKLFHQIIQFILNGVVLLLKIKNLLFFIQKVKLQLSGEHKKGTVWRL
jgi:hypothetical protein